MADLLSPDTILMLAGSTALVALAIWLVVLDMRRAANLAFAAYLGVWGFTIGLNILSQAIGGWRGLWLYRVEWYGFLAGGFAILYLAFVYPRPWGFFGKHPMGKWLLPAAALLAPVIYGIDHGLVVASGGDTGAENYTVITGFGPFNFLWGLGLVAPALAGLIIAWRARAESAAVQSAMSFMVLGMLIYPVHRAGEFIVSGIRGTGIWALMDQFGAPDAGYAMVTVALTIAALPVAVAAAVRLRLGIHAGHRVGTLPIAAFLVFGAVLGVARAFGDKLAWPEFVYFTLGFLPMPFLITYAILRHQLFDIDLKVKWTISKTTIAAIFVAVVFLATEGAQIIFGEGNAWLGWLAGGALIFALAPLQRFADRVADRAMPGVADTADFRAGRKEEIFAHAVESMLADQQFSAHERATLMRLQEDLGIPAEDAQRIEKRVLARLAA